MVFNRLRFAVRAAFTHLFVSVFTALLLGMLILKVWYPAPFDSLSAGRGLLFLIVAVDVVCGPLLTLVLYNPQKSKLKWGIDLSVIVTVQLAALGYGVFQAAAVRPVFMAFEGDRFRVVLASDIQRQQLTDAPLALRTIAYSGPKLIAAKLLKSDDPDYPQSVQLSMAGIHPSFRPARWQEYSDQTHVVLKNLRPIEELFKKPATDVEKLNKAISSAGLSANALGFLPLVNDNITDWIVLIRKDDAHPLVYLNIDSW